MEKAAYYLQTDIFLEAVAENRNMEITPCNCVITSSLITNNKPESALPIRHRGKC